MKYRTKSGETAVILYSIPNDVRAKKYIHYGYVYCSVLKKKIAAKWSKSGRSNESGWSIEDTKPSQF